MSLTYNEALSGESVSDLYTLSALNIVSCAVGPNGPTGLGIALEKEAVNVATLRDAIERVANEPAFRQRVEHMQQLTRDAGGYQRASNAIMQFTQEQVKR